MSNRTQFDSLENLQCVESHGMVYLDIDQDTVDALVELATVAELTRDMLEQMRVMVCLPRMHKDYCENKERLDAAISALRKEVMYE